MSRLQTLKSQFENHVDWYYVLVSVLIVLLLTVGQVSAFSGSGAGTSGDPWQITSTTQWNEMNSNGNSKYFKLMNDIDWSGSTPTMITTYPYLDGNGKAIKNFIVPTQNNVYYAGLFDHNVNVHDLSIFGADLHKVANIPSSAYGGIVVAQQDSGGSISKVFIDSTSSVSITTTNGITLGGLVGIIGGNYPITYCGVLAPVTIGTNGYAGGLAGAVDAGSHISDSYYAGTITGSGAPAGDYGEIAYLVSSGNFGSYHDYYDSTKSSGGSTNSATAESTANMKNQATFSTWTFDATHWRMSYSSGSSGWAGYPVWYTTEDIPPAPVAGFTLSQSSFAPGNASVTLTDTSTNTPTSWQVSWGDGTSNSTTAPFTHTYSNPASTTTYTIGMTATNSGGSGYTSQNVVFYRTPVADFSGNRTSILTGQAVAFTDAATNTPTSWAWDFSYSGSFSSESTSQNPVYVFSSPGTFTIAEIASNLAGDGGVQKINYVTVADSITSIATPSFTTPISSGSNDPVEVTWSGTATAIAVYIGAASAGHSSPTSPDTVYVATPTSGTFDLKVRLTDVEGGYHWFNQTNAVTISGPVTAAFTMNSSSGDYPLTVAFTDTSTGGTYYGDQWNFGDGYTSSYENPTHTFSTAGTYSVSLLHVNTVGDSGYVTHNVTVTTPAAPTASWSANLTSGLYPLHVAFTDASTGGVAPLSYTWSFGDGGSSTAQNPTYTFNAAGYYTVTETVTDAIGHTGTHAATIHPYAAGAPATDFSFSPSTGNAPLTVNFTDATTGSPDSWNWTLGDGNTSTSQNVSHTYAAGTFSVTLTTHTTGGYSSLTRSLTVLPTAPIASFTPSVTSGTAPLAVTFTDTSTHSPTSWAWDFGDGSTSTLENPSHTYITNGNYTVALTESNAGGSSYTSVLIQVTPSGTPSGSPNGTYLPDVHYFSTTAPGIDYLPWNTTIYSPVTPVSTWLGDTIDVRVNTSGVTTYGGYTVDGWKAAFYKQVPEKPGEYTSPVETKPLTLNYNSAWNWTVNTTETVPNDLNYGNATYLLYLFAINNTYHAGPGETDYGSGLIPVANRTVNVEYAPPLLSWSWTNPNRNPVPGETVTLHYWLNSFKGQVSQNTYYLYVEKSVNGGATWVSVTGYPAAVTSDGSVTFSTTQAELIRARLVAGHVVLGILTDQISSYYYLVSVETTPTAPSFLWKNNVGTTITSAVDTDTIRYGLDTGNAWQNHNYPSLTLTFYKYNVATQVWDALAAPAPVTWTWGQQRLQESGSIVLSSLFDPTDSQVKLRAVAKTGNTVIAQSSDLTVRRNAINPENAANAAGGWMGLGAGNGGILFGTIITAILAFVAFLLIRDARVVILAALAGIVISFALGLYPLWLIVIAGILGIVVLLFASGILNRGESGGSGGTNLEG